MAIKGNRGEWSELYAFLKILTDGKIFNASKNLELLKDNFYIVLQIIREESDGKKIYDISKNNNSVVVTDEKGSLNKVIDLKEIKNGVAKIFETIKNSNGTTFKISLAEGYMKDLNCLQIKASNRRKSDLSIVLYDKKSPSLQELGFSVKSMLGSPSTLLNASGATNFIYKVVGGKGVDLIKTESLTVRDKGKFVYGVEGNLEYCEMDSEGFRRNLRKVDSNFPEIIAEMIKNYYNGKGAKVSELIDCMAKNREFCEKLDLNKSDFIFKIKRFLSDVALGMTPKKDWDGYAKAHGGYIIVKEDGDVVCYHIYNRDQFEEYLYNNTKFDTPSTTRHKFGKFYEEDGEIKIKYNLQIRFTK